MPGKTKITITSRYRAQTALRFKMELPPGDSFQNRLCFSDAQAKLEWTYQQVADIIDGSPGATAGLPSSVFGSKQLVGRLPLH